MNESLRKNRKWLVIGGVVILLAILGTSLYFLIMDAINSATVSVTVAPSIAKVRIGDKDYAAIGTYKMKPGEYEVVVSAEGFETKTGTLTAVENETTNIMLFLETDDMNWYNNHPEDALIMGEVQNARTVELLKEMGEKYPILNKLPISRDYFLPNYSGKVKYTISYEMVDNANGFSIIITDYMGGAEDAAMKELMSLDDNVSGYDVKYNDISSEWLMNGVAEQ